MNLDFAEFTKKKVDGEDSELGEGVKGKGEGVGKG
jgi:hypothetical protein